MTAYAIGHLYDVKLGLYVPRTLPTKRRRARYANAYEGARTSVAW